MRGDVLLAVAALVAGLLVVPAALGAYVATVVIRDVRGDER